MTELDRGLFGDGNSSHVPVTAEHLLAATSGLADSAWASIVAENFGAVASEEQLVEDLETLDSIAEARNNFWRSRRVTSIAFVGMAAGIGIGFTIEIFGDRISLLEGKTLIPALVVAVGGAALWNRSAVKSSMADSRLNLAVESWNSRGKNWLHQQRDRMFGGR